ncbi:hypothetical protein [Nostoc sp. NMS4]|uniref:hypothetical protein n=1 Tax=Nostoc sp. NMS4 TaxID=2815390 RepID=UPI0025E0D42B|nr:hypothetical protein [Nostoc sp. NMS4]MBN3925375.1 hypothetical protein [Nostoc sp. NMS4]
MSNYLFDLIAKSFNLIDTVQPLILSVFEPLPESNVDWEASIATDSTELETISQTDRFRKFEIARSPVTIGQISEEITNPLLTNLTSTPIQFSQQILKLIPNLAQKPNLELSPNWLFSDSVLTQISTDNQQLTSKPEQKTSNTPPNLAPAQLLQKESNKINLIVSSVQPSNTEQKTSTTPPNLIPDQLSQKQLTKINPVISYVQPSNIVNWERLITQPFVESEILLPTANQAVINPNTESIVVPQRKTYLSNNLVYVHNTESNTSLSNPIFEQRQIPPKSFSQQLITINRLGLSLQSPLKSDVQTYFTENLTKPVIFSFTPQDKTFSLPNLNPTILKPAIAKKNNTHISKLFDKKSGALTTQSLNNQSSEINQLASPNCLPKVLYLREYLPQIQAKTSTSLSTPSILKPGKSVTENLHKQPIQINPVFIHSQLPQSEISEDFPPQLQSESTTISTTGNSSRGYTNAYASDIYQVLPLTSMLAVETSTPAFTVIQPQEQLVSELSQKRWLRQRQGRSLQAENISTSEILLSQIIEQPTAIAPAITQVLPLTPVTTIDTSHSALSSVIQPQVKHGAIPSLRDATHSLLPRRGTVSSAKASTIYSTLANSHKQSLIPTIAIETIAEPQEKLTSKGLPRNKLSILWGGHLTRPNNGTGEDTHPTRKSGMFFYLEVPNVPENQQRFVHKNLSSMQPFIANASSKLSSLQTNSFTAPFVNNLPSSVASQPTTQLTPINSDIISTPALYPSTAENNIQSQVNFSDSHLSYFRGERASTQEVGLKNYNRSDRQDVHIQKIGVVEQWDEFVNYAHHPANMQRQQINPNEGILTSPVENSILPQNPFPNLSMSADRFKERQDIHIQKIGVVEQWDEFVNYAHHPANMQRQQINPNEGILTSPVENSILPQNPFPNLSMSADKFKERQDISIQKRSSYFRQLEESDFRPLSGSINDLTVKNLSVIAASNKKVQKRWRSPSQTSPPKYDAPPPIQVTIGRLEIRNAAPAPPPPRPKPRPATSVMSLNEYLQRRAARRR